MSPKHLGLYVAEFSGRHNQRPLSTADQMGRVDAGMDCKRLPYAVLTYKLAYCLITNAPQASRMPGADTLPPLIGGTHRDSARST